MKNSVKTIMLLVFMCLPAVQIKAQNNHQNQQSKNEQQMKQVLIDKITVPASAKEEFIARMNANRAIIKKLPGFIKDEVYEQQSDNGDTVFVTMATWENAASINKAKVTVQEEYKRIGFNLPEFCQKLNIKIERGIYQPFNQ